MVKFEALVKESGVYFICETHQAHCLIFHLGHQSFVVVSLGGDELRKEVFTVGFSDSFRLVVEDVSQVIVILLLSSSDFDKWKHQHSRREERPRGRGNASHVLEDLWIFAFYLFEVNAEWVEAVVDVIFISIASYLVKK